MKRFRFSLLSLLVGVVLAGGVVFLNVRPSTYSSPPPAYRDESGMILTTFYSTEVSEYGWPFVVCEHLLFTDPARSALAPRGEYFVRMPSLAANIAIGLVIVFGGAGVCEWLVRRRATKAKE